MIFIIFKLFVLELQERILALVFLALLILLYLDSLACLSQSIFVRPVPAGTNLPTITFSFNPSKVSTLPFIEASVKNSCCFLKEAAEINEFVCKEALVIPNKILSKTAGFFFSS